MAKPRLTRSVKSWIDCMAMVLDNRLAWRLAPLLAGMLFATGRRTVSSWLRAGDLSRYYQDYYYLLSASGRKVKSLAAVVLHIAVKQIAPSGRLLLALDDTPTKRYGPKVEGAGIHHNPTPGPAGSKFLYGHNWVTLAWVVRHPLWGAIALPLLARLYVRQQDVVAQQLTFFYQVGFQTKLVMASELVGWAVQLLHALGLKLWVVVDGAYAKRVFLKALAQAQVITVSRLRRDAALRDLPVQTAKRPCGRPPIYGKHRISLAKRAGHRCGWQTATFLLYGKEQTKRFKTFLATYRPAGGLIRVVIVKEEDHSWRAYFCTHANASVAEILEAVADRAAVEQVFHDLKEVHGVAQAQTRNYWSNVAVYHIAIWWHTLIELWAWDRPASALVNRQLSPWDDATRRPSHADKRSALRRQCLEEEYQAGTSFGAVPRKIQSLVSRLIRSATC